MAFLFVALLFNVIDRSTGYRTPLFGLRPTVIVTESMQTVNDSNDYIDPSWERINKYDVVITQNYSYKDLKQYDVITYLDNKGRLICHRIIDIYEDNTGEYVITRGDANNTNDKPVKSESIRGKVIAVWHGVGSVVSFVTSLYFLLAIFLSMFFIAGGYIVYYLISNKKEKGEQTKNEK